MLPGSFCHRVAIGMVYLVRLNSELSEECTLDNAAPVRLFPQPHNSRWGGYRSRTLLIITIHLQSLFEDSFYLLSRKFPEGSVMAAPMAPDLSLEIPQSHPCRICLLHRTHPRHPPLARSRLKKAMWEASWIWPLSIGCSTGPTVPPLHTDPVGWTQVDDGAPGCPPCRLRPGTGPASTQAVGSLQASWLPAGI